MKVIWVARTFAGIVALGCSMSSSGIAVAQGLDAQRNLNVQQQKLQLIVQSIPDTADRICYNVSQNSEQSNKDIHGDVKAQLDGLFSKLVGGGVSAGGNITNNETKGVLQSDLVAAMKNSEDCKLEVLKILVARLLPSESAPTLPPPSPQSRDETATAQQSRAPAPTEISVRAPTATNAPKSGASMSCDELWHERNAIYARNGYCFKTAKAIAAFGKSCFPPYGALQGPDRNRVAEISIWEKQKACLI
jgi:hypothetical protein